MGIECRRSYTHFGVQQQKQIPVSRRQQKPTTPVQQPLTKSECQRNIIYQVLEILANVPPKLVAEILVAKQQKESSSSERLTSEAERKAQQKELQRLREQNRPGKSRSKSEKSSKGDEANPLFNLRELMKRCLEGA